MTQLPIPPPSKTREHLERGKQRLAKLLTILKKLHSGLGQVGDYWMKTSKHLNKNFSEMYGDSGENVYSNWGVWSDESTASPRRRKKKRKQHK